MRYPCGLRVVSVRFWARTCLEIPRNSAKSLVVVEDHADTCSMAIVQTSPLLPGVKGSLGNIVFVPSPYGIQLRERSIPDDPKTAAQMASRERLTRAAITWTTMTPEQAQNWRAYATAQNPDGPNARANAQLLFTKLAVRFLQMNPQAAIPLDPPASPFLGDAVQFEVSKTESGVRVVADRPNAAGTTTEILLQPLLSVHRRTYVSKYRTAVFDDFEASLTVDLEAYGPAVAVAVRFLRTATGQATELFELGTV